LSRDDEERLRRGYEAFNEGGVDAILQWLAPEITVHDRESGPDRDTHHGLIGVKQLFESTMEAFDQFELEPLEFIEVGDRMVVVLLQRARGRGSGVVLESEVAHVWMMGEGIPAGMRIYGGKEQALAAVRAEQGG
jgi:ketosteroid isomerase-like protein